MGDGRGDVVSLVFSEPSENHQKIISLASVFFYFDAVASTMRQMEDDMSNRRKPILTFREISQDGTVVKRNITRDLPGGDRRRQTWQCKVARVLHASIMIYANPSLAPVYIAAAMKQNNRR